MSTRMGKDKALISYHGISQLEYLTDLLNPYCEQVFVSSKGEDDYANHPVIEDRFDVESPLNGILSALIKYPENAWLVLACDMPFIDAQSIEHLISCRSLDKLAVCYTNNANLIEPLLSIWEPNSIEALKIFQNSGELSPRKFLTANKVNLVRPNDFRILTNVNTIEEFEQIKKIQSSRS